MDLRTTITTVVSDFYKDEVKLKQKETQSKIDSLIKEVEIVVSKIMKDGNAQIVENSGSPLDVKKTLIEKVLSQAKIEANFKFKMIELVNPSNAADTWSMKSYTITAVIKKPDAS
jgi:hypothetical protein